MADGRDRCNRAGELSNKNLGYSPAGALKKFQKFIFAAVDLKMRCFKKMPLEGRYNMRLQYHLRVVR